MQLSRYEIDKQNELKSVKEKSESISHSTLEIQKHNYESKLKIKEEEITKIKQILDIKNQEIFALIE